MKPLRNDKNIQAHYSRAELQSHFKNIEMNDFFYYHQENFIERRKKMEGKKIEEQLNNRILKRELFNDVIGVSMKYLSLKSTTVG